MCQMKTVSPNRACLRSRNECVCGEEFFFKPGHNVRLPSEPSLFRNIQSTSSNRTEAELPLKEQPGVFYYQEREGKQKNILRNQIKL